MPPLLSLHFQLHKFTGKTHNLLTCQQRLGQCCISQKLSDYHYDELSTFTLMRYMEINQIYFSVLNHRNRYKNFE